YRAQETTRAVGGLALAASSRGHRSQAGPSRRTDGMGMTKEIVVGVDASDSGLAAVRWAADVAAARQAPLRLVTILPRWAYEMPDDGRYAEVGQWAREDAGNVIARARSAASDGRQIGRAHV